MAVKSVRDVALLAAGFAAEHFDPPDFGIYELLLMASGNGRVHIVSILDKCRVDIGKCVVVWQQTASARDAQELLLRVASK